MSDKITEMPITATVPRDWLKAVIWPARRPTETRVVHIDDKKYEIGGFNPLDKDDKTIPTFSIKHGGVCYNILSFYDQLDRPEDGKAHFSMNEFCLRYANSNGGRYSRDIRLLFSDLTKGFFRVTAPDEDPKTYRILERIAISDRYPRRKDSKLIKEGQMELWLDEVQFSKEFLDFMIKVAERGRIRVDVLKSISSLPAKCIYTYAPSRAVHHTEHNPWEINATNLLVEINEPVPEGKKRRKAKFVGKRDGRPSIIEQLDGAKLMNGRLRVGIAETKDKSDWKLLFWAEDVTDNVVSVPSLASKSKLLDAFMASGKGDKKEFNRVVKDRAPLSDYEVELLHNSGIHYGESEQFLEMVKVIIGAGRFQTILAEIKGNILEPNSKIKNPAKILNHRLMEAVNPNK